MPKKKVSLKWLAFSADPLAVKFRRDIDRGHRECALCCMFFGDDYTDTDDNTEACSFNEICENEISHFQQMANGEGFNIEIVSLEYLPEEVTSREKVEFT
jgi:hypothetical protein